MGVINYTTAKINDLLKKVEEAPEKLENGKTPVFITGTTTTLDPGMSATAEVVLAGTDSEGNPQYKINLGVPKGLDGVGGSGGGVADSVQWANVLNKPSWIGPTKPTYTATEVGALPATTIIPYKVSQLANDSGYLTSSGFKTINGENIVGSGDIVIESSGGGTGNVNVTNASGLNKGNYYAFKPSADGSVEGTFSTIPDATESKAGLMSSFNYEKLGNMKPVISLHLAVASLTNNSTSEEILQAFGAESSQANALLNMMLLYSNAEVVEYDADYPQAFIGNIPVVMRCTYDSEAASGTLELTYVAAGGKLRTITISGKQGGTSPDLTYTYSCAVTESGDDTYYLPHSIINLETATEESLKNVFGGEDAIRVFIQEAVLAEKHVYILYNGIKEVAPGLYSGIQYHIPVSIKCTAFASILVSVSFIYSYDTYNFIHKCVKFNYDVENNSCLDIEINKIYLNGYILNQNLYSLSDSSSSDDISIAIGGEDGMKRIIKAIKDGNTFFTVGSLGDGNQKTQLLPNIYAEKENGDLSIAFVGFGYMIWGGLGGILMIIYTKISNTFTCSITPIG